ncbi:MAG TPA: hypothetical protein VGB69_01675 [Edaphobacter sp.]
MQSLRRLVLLPVLLLSGCHSAYVEATVSNHTSQMIDLIEVEYPSASFGTQSLAPGADFHYRFKVIGEGKVKITYTDTAHNEKKAEGPDLNESSEGKLLIDIQPGSVQWQDKTAHH